MTLLLIINELQNWICKSNLLGRKYLAGISQRERAPQLKIVLTVRRAKLPVNLTGGIYGQPNVRLYRIVSANKWDGELLTPYQWNEQRNGRSERRETERDGGRTAYQRAPTKKAKNPHRIFGNGTPPIRLGSVFFSRAGSQFGGDTHSLKICDIFLTSP